MDGRLAKLCEYAEVVLSKTVDNYCLELFSGESCIWKAQAPKIEQVVDQAIQWCTKEQLPQRAI